MTTRLSTTTGRRSAIMRIARSDIREVASTMPSTVAVARSRVSRSRAPDSWASASSMV